MLVKAYGCVVYGINPGGVVSTLDAVQGAFFERWFFLTTSDFFTFVRMPLFSEKKGEHNTHVKTGCREN